MKAVANGGLHVSTLDGWWDEAWRDNETRPIGWAIGRGESYPNPAEQEAIEAESLYELLEQEIVPTFYDRTDEDLPRQWTARMKASISALCWRFNTHRMVWEYDQQFYRPAVARYEALTADGLARATALAEAKTRLAALWASVGVEEVDGDPRAELFVGQPLAVRTVVRLGQLAPEEVDVQLYAGRVDPRGELTGVSVVPMRCVGSVGDGRYRYETAEQRGCVGSGLHGFSIRVLPSHPDLQAAFVPGLIAWAPSDQTGP
jgi:starch phosphorylase